MTIYSPSTGDAIEVELQDASQSLSRFWKFAQNATTTFLRNFVLLFGAFIGSSFIANTLSYFDYVFRL